MSGLPIFGISRLRHCHVSFTCPDLRLSVRPVMGYVCGAGINDGQLMDNPWINASSREVTVSSIGCAYRAELILGR